MSVCDLEQLLFLGYLFGYCLRFRHSLYEKKRGQTVFPLLVFREKINVDLVPAAACDK